MNDYEIRTVKNGWMVYPINMNKGTITACDEVLVFNSFEALAAFLKKNCVPGKK